MEAVLLNKEARMMVLVVVSLMEVSSCLREKLKVMKALLNETLEARAT